MKLREKIKCPHCGKPFPVSEFSDLVKIDFTFEDEGRWRGIACPNCGKRMDICMEAEHTFYFETEKSEAT